MTSSYVNGTTTTYAYRGDGLRKSKTTNSVTTNHVWDGDQIVQDLNGIDLVREYVRGLRLIDTYATGDIHRTAYIQNARGDVVGYVHDLGGTTDLVDYDAFGNPETAFLNDPLGYCGEYRDAETGFIYLRARYYDPRIGRFTSEDTHWNTENMIYGDEPMGYGEVNRVFKELMGQLLSNPSYNDLIPDLNAILQSGNLYAYCMNNPVNFVDPNGESVIVIFGITISIWEALAAGFTFAFLMDLATQGPLSTAFVEAVQEQGKNIVDALGYAKNVVQSKKQSKESGKEKASDTPSWAKGKKPRRGESGAEFARRLCDEKYGKGNYRTGPGSEYNKLKKYGDRGGKQ